MFTWSMPRLCSPEVWGTSPTSESPSWTLVAISPRGRSTWSLIDTPRAVFWIAPSIFAPVSRAALALRCARVRRGWTVLMWRVGVAAPEQRKPRQPASLPFIAESSVAIDSSD